MRKIKITKGQFTLVDDDMFDYLNQWKWQAYKSPYKKIYYVVRKPHKDENRGLIVRMHREIMNTPIDMQVDHIDGNGLNNQKENLRLCTNRQNSRNRKRKGNKSIYSGVNLTRGLIIAQIQVDKKIHLGTFKTEEDAARAYDEAAKKYFGEFAHLNFPKE